MHLRLFLYGLAIWIVATAYLRIDGQHLLYPGHTAGTLILFAINFPLMVLVGRAAFKSARLPEEQWPAGAISLLLPTLLLDPFTSTFLSIAFPNIPAEVAGKFGGQMLWCCAGVLVGAI